MARKKRILAISLCMVLATGIISQSFLVANAAIGFDALVPIGGMLGKLGTNITLAEIIITQLASAGAGVTNTSWLNQLASNFGTAAYSVGEMYSQGLIDAIPNAGGTAWEFIDTGLQAQLAQSAAWQDLGIDAMFTVDSFEAAEWAIPEASSTESMLQSIASGVNWGTVAKGAGAVGGGIALGLLLNHVNQQFGKQMQNGLPMDASSTILSHIAAGYTSGVIVNSSNQTQIYSINGGGFVCGISDGRVLFVNPTNQPVTWTFYGSWGSNWSGTVPANSQSLASYGANYATSKMYTMPYYPNAGLYDPLNWYRNGTINPFTRISPDIVGEYGNAQANYTNNQYVSNLTNVVNNNDNTGVKPIGYGDYINWVNDANDNTDNGITDQVQGDLFRDLINPYIEDIDTSKPVIRPSVEDPVPDQPDYRPKQTEISQTEIDLADPYTAPDLLDRFPFCIPNDIKSLFEKFVSGDRRAPHIVWRYHSNLFNYDINLDVDFSVFDDAASILRTLELIAFILGLMIGTRRLIGD